SARFDSVDSRSSATIEIRRTPHPVRDARVKLPDPPAGFGAPLFAVHGAATGHGPDGYGDAPFTVWAVWPRSICGLCASALSQERRHESVGTLFVTLLERVAKPPGARARRDRPRVHYGQRR